MLNYGPTLNMLARKPRGQTLREWVKARVIAKDSGKLELGVTKSI